MKLRLSIKNIDCPHCALELETKFKNLEEINEASINFPMSLLIVDVSEDADEDEIEALLQKVATSFEDGITVELSD